MYPFIKRLMDIFASVLLLLLLMPMFIVVALLIKLGSKGPLLFTQERLGFNGNVFKLYKFRSMTDAKRDALEQVHQNTAEITWIGNIIRRLKIDELPQLLNVLVGDMSLVGPRPCMEATKLDFNEDGHKRLLVRPGLTGLAQVNGNIFLDWPERWALDREYVENVSLMLDIKIILRTVLIVVLGEQWGKKGRKS
ncbi:Undecaprenyl phosphate N,N'-diacetylbacillosamine 1-phosphate transferase [Marinobacterium sp. xm-g-59]|uniref:sugar transferase n=1 Tax=Marinobacterium sp. xm-g-59 TaxID=2497748 RepID=UPI001568B445|nr:sugar transferase [Marinobacterium sp. xm-g-59]NRP95490.1 Undecaprenyl phosphate N,N'-diacetylbacillosamine 1-phosphate transferase [Marinobacterium sp. xm-g-59]